MTTQREEYISKRRCEISVDFLKSRKKCKLTAREMLKANIFVDEQAAKLCSNSWVNRFSFVDDIKECLAA